MRFSVTASVATLLTLAVVSKAQDANCSAVLNDYSPAATGQFQKCYTERVYNQALVASNPPNYKDIINSVCSKSACSHSTLSSAGTKYMAACSASIDSEATASGGNILQLGKNALEVFFAEPIRASYCALDPSAIPLPPPQVTPPSYCLAADVANPSTRFVANLAIYLTEGSIRSTQAPFFIANNLDSKDVCSECSQIAVTATIEYLSKNLMPRIAQFYTPEFVQYWTKLVPEYNKLCKTTYTQTWPQGTLNTTVPNVPQGSPSAPVVPGPTASGSAGGSTPSKTPTSAAGSIKPVAGAAAALMMAVALLI
ncbi:hypothetical protein KVV02_001997 [Mortierella alpina]|uniref:Uncharacterized protein n=1 Tax=Mortierella alpina TaxID=64518 RepID=A0A9P8A7P3_MORAP|nr:hypothetical protein KVV02_001997 [Mortierella alpina]